MAQGSFHGRFVWQELMTEDTASAATFYSKVVGWHTQPSAVDKSYTQFGIGSSYYAGMMHIPDEARASGAIARRRSLSCRTRFTTRFRSSPSTP